MKHPERLRELYLVIWGDETIAVCDTYKDAKEYIEYDDKDGEKGLKIKPFALTKMAQ